jgi:Protein of unknown function (DUF1360)
MSKANPGIRFAVAALATWRVTHLLASEDGPADSVVRLRARLGQGTAGRLMDCFQCLSVWVAAPASRFVTREPRALLPTWLALSGAACLLEGRGSEAVVIEREVEEGGRDRMLWGEASGA